MAVPVHVQSPTGALSIVADKHLTAHKHLYTVLHPSHGTQEATLSSLQRQAMPPCYLHAHNMNHHISIFIIRGNGLHTPCYPTTTPRCMSEQRPVQGHESQPSSVVTSSRNPVWPVRKAPWIRSPIFVLD